jgi:hypothetical protein
MSGRTGTNHPGHRPVVDRVRQLQRGLWVAAKRSPERRFQALMDRVCRGDILQEAWRRVKRNRGAAGVDRETLSAVEQYGIERMLNELGTGLRAGEAARACGARRQPRLDADTFATTSAASTTSGCSHWWLDAPRTGGC